MLNIYITNLGKYNEGELIGEWAELPVNEEELEEILDRIGINEEYEEYFITDFETDIEGLEISEHSNIEQLNELAKELEELEEYEIEQLKALLGCGYIDFYDMLEGDICRLSGNYTFIQLDDRSLLDDENLGRSYIEEICCGDLSCIENIAYYFDIEAFSRDLRFDRDMIIENLYEEDIEYYENMTDIEFAENYIERLGDIEELGQETLERYFNYELYGTDLRYENICIASNYLAIVS
ncbi:TPA: antirestriction protein ArdA [Clostridioides difficile]|uniref:antirestriction protein ArdA n=1 Tax=Clostridioides difficile TaxID=1496 RepID=UPI00038DB881|nr:antirestriction protein ArdA [Clostridioides difficile]EQG38281.1 antirestriction family protein [Clostridioides difficile DA00129]HBF0262914.1 antirestriction protein ArdA [Clostridioides difficile]HBF4022115.1 antirestriction protein ArdA [Clostridioides difficile]HBF4499145.1 antirestriction protein ArdA [Clostridioides difficile]HBG8638468.1 antirestriction protein ArdA [Clostridioides difficile]